jgi:hypothetical protein
MIVSSLTFFYPDYTVDPGVSPGHASWMRVGYTTDRELELCSSPCPEGYYSSVDLSINIPSSYVNWIVNFIATIYDLI